jgi:bacteriorhodopsin
MSTKNENLIVNNYVKQTFNITFIVLLTTGTITFIEAIRTQSPLVRHVLNLETCISIIAGYFYSVFMEKVNNTGEFFDWKDITQSRYLDWAITTPLMILTLCIVLGSNLKKRLYFTTFLVLMFLNYCMLFAGYLGEIGYLHRLLANILGFIPFILMFSIIFILFVMPKFMLDNYILFFVYLFLWAMYGVVYLFNEEYKNICLNILDLIAKCFVGLGVWAYYTKIFG